MSKIIDNQGKIIPNLRGDIMRSSMENKNILSRKGSLYVGTGTAISKTAATTDGGFETIQIPKTTNLDPGSVHQVLCNLDTNGNLGYRFIGPDMVQEGAVYDIKCTRAHNAEYVVSAEEATYPTGARISDKRTLEERLTAAETPVVGFCDFSEFNTHHSHGRIGDISLNKLYKKGVGVTLSFSMYNSLFYSDDTLVLQIPREFRPLSPVSITVGINASISYSGQVHDPGDVFFRNRDFSGNTRYFTVQYQTQISYDGTITITGDEIARLAREAEVVSGLVKESKVICRGIYIYAGWNIYQGIY